MVGELVTVSIMAELLRELTAENLISFTRLRKDDRMSTDLWMKLVRI